MKKITLSLFLIAFTSFQIKPKLIYFDIETRDEAGKIVPACMLTVMSSFDNKSCRYNTDKSGKCFFSIPVIPVGSTAIVMIEAFGKNTISYSHFDKLEELNDGDTVRGVVTIYQPKKTVSR